MFDWFHALSPDNQGKVITGAVGIFGTLMGALIGGAINWRLTRSTQAIQKTIADAAIANQQAIATNAIENQKAIAANNLKAQERAGIDALLVRMLDFMMSHPQLESDAVCQAYPNIGNANLNNGENTKMRYETYCIFVFNFLLRAFKHFDNDGVKLGDYIGLEEIVKCHHKWWNHDPENYGYDAPFRDCIRKVYEKLHREGKIK
jgi:hypothetical protein